MNVLFILADQHNPAFAGCYGGITRTPNLDALAEAGTVFESAYTPCPMCAPARACLFSGKQVHENGCWDNCFPYDGEKQPGWGHYFRKKGIHVATIGKLDFAAGKDNGVDSVFEPDDRVSLDVVSLFRTPPLLLRPKYHMVNNWDVSVRRTEEHLEQNIVRETKRWFREEMPSGQPWILNVNFLKPHSPWHPLREKFEYYRDKITLSEKYLQPEWALNEVDRQQSRHTCGYILNEEHVKDCHAAYHAIVEEHDENVGQVIQALKESGQYENTLIIYSADHGELLRAHGAFEKSSMYEDSIRIPLIVKLPGTGRKRIKEPVSLMDVFPTVNDWFGYEKPETFGGYSLLGLIRGEKSAREEAVITQSHANGRITGTFAIRQGKWKYMYYDGYGELLFDLQNDPEECRNLAEMEAYRYQKEILRRELERLAGEKGLSAISREAMEAQRCLREELETSGQLSRELGKRGFCLKEGTLYYLP